MDEKPTDAYGEPPTEKDLARIERCLPSRDAPDPLGRFAVTLGAVGDPRQAYFDTDDVYSLVDEVRRLRALTMHEHIRAYLVEMTRVNGLPLRTPQRYSVQFTVDEDGVVYLQHEECVLVDREGPEVCRVCAAPFKRLGLPRHEPYGIGCATAGPPEPKS